MRIGIGSDHRGFTLKEVLKNFLKKEGHQVVDFGTDSTNSVDYPDYAIPLAEAVARGELDRGILICNTGIGMSIAANKVKGVYAALVYHIDLASYSRLHNNSNVLCMGAEYTPPKKAEEIVKIWLKTSFEGGRHERRINKIRSYEKGEQ
ncbi:ribose 5-phosphate isomerase B [bacterium]|nr:MAG: ribose 5-phosphate isomerase B [bacterium]RKZ20850.1 MAG: ribose 5-phosphate isomerase B [bacterium]